MRVRVRVRVRKLLKNRFGPLAPMESLAIFLKQLLVVSRGPLFIAGVSPNRPWGPLYVEEVGGLCVCVCLCVCACVCARARACVRVLLD